MSFMATKKNFTFLFNRSREPYHDSASGVSFTGQESTDHGPERATRTGIQVESSLRLQLSSGGCFLDPEKYEPVKFLGSGGFAKVLLLIEGFGANRA